MKNLKWWFRLDNPRLIYLLTGGMFVAAADCVVRAFEGSLLFATAGGFISYAATRLVGWQRQREEAESERRMIDDEAVANEVMQTIANHINDELESEGYGRPVCVERDRLTIH